MMMSFSPENQSYHFHYQPIYVDNEIKSFEALLRLSDKSVDIENYILSIHNKVQFDLNVIQNVLFDVKDISEDIGISINISINSLESEYFVQQCIELLKDKTNIILEITEHDKANNLNLIAQNISVLKNELAVKFALDDFGRGYSNTESLMRLPVDIIKVDRCLVGDITDSYISYAVLKTKINKIINLLEKSVIVEGIESKKQLDLIDLIGACNVQGFFLSKPLPKEDAFALSDFTMQRENQNKLDFVQKLDKMIYDLTINRNNIIEYTFFNKFFCDKDNDFVLTNAKKMLAQLKDPTLLMLSSLLNDCDNFIIIRDSDGVAIYNNQNHINYMGADFVGIPPEQLYDAYAGYQPCIDLDSKLLNSNSNFLISNESVSTGSEIQSFQTFRQKIQYIGKFFIVCTVYRDSNTLTMRKDSLTGLYSREILLTEYIKKYSNLIFIDLNGFKKINDELGHHMGDLVLKEVADILCNNLRNDELITRYGGDEFLVFTMMNDPILITRRLNEVNDIIIHHFQEKNIELSFSFGFSVNYNNVELAIEMADKNMYQHKKRTATLTTKN